ncbi:germination protein YpeB [Domibacillus epiphyticus]|uniref:Germination protein YpeB n=1 Tax=Domibacillus epiphyticus TaxID=1714355 RepID=A0A1V2A4F2_9BACI|nr:germination protein YpeB [Domibacillus epiphyticus]OMP65879.1 germination protein YpeB [Domibacillus epiphyticus]
MRSFTPAVLAVLLAVTAYWGYTQYRQKEALMIEAENGYQQAFHELVYQVDVIHDRTGEALAMNSKENLTPALTDVWRLTSEAHNAISRLPLGYLPFSKTEEFLGNSGNFTYKTAVRDLDQEPLSDKEYEQLESLYSQAEDIQKELRSVQLSVLDKNLRWTDVAHANANGEEPKDNTVVDGFNNIEKKASEFPETDVFQATQVEKSVSDDALKKLSGENISKDEAASIAKEYFNIDPEVTKVEKSLKDAAIPFYNVSVTGQKGEEATMDVTEKGGYPLTFTVNRDTKKSKISLNNASEKASAFLEKHGFDNMVMTNSAQYDHTGVFTFTRKQGDTMIYPESLTMKVALDNGVVTGLEAQNYWKNKKERKIESPALTVEQAKKELHPKLSVMEAQQAIVTNNLLKDVLCYEFLAENGTASYRIFINANNGKEERIEKLSEAEAGY